MFRLPDFFRPYAGSIIGSAVTIGLGVAASKVPGLNNFITPDTANHVTEIVLGYLFAHTATTVVNSTVNPTQSATVELAKSVPVTVNDKSAGTTNVSPTVNK